MIIIKERNNNNEIYFECEVIDDLNKKICTNKIYYRSFIKDKDETTYLMLYDTNMEPISDVFGFLNFNNTNQSINSKAKSLQALKLLYCYQSIINKNLEDFTLADINGLKIFLKGLSQNGQTMRFELCSSRNNKTVNSYLSVYRQYLKYLGKNNKILSEKSSIKSLITDPYDDLNYTVDKYLTNEKVPKPITEVPRYIRVDEFKRIMDIIRKKYTTREEIIVRLMFQCGLRIGEVLGLTADDVVMEKVYGVFVPIIYIRNRVTDSPFQHAKTCMKVIDKKQYKSNEYQLKDYGYQTVVVPEDLYDLINYYIEDQHTYARNNKHDNYYKSTIADRIRPSEPYEDDNYYIFINSLGKPLSIISWNNIIREIFAKCKIPIDKDVKKHNLNHRFRHGFAMFNVQYLGCNELELQERMRHQSLKSVSCYFRPTISDAIKVKTEFAKSLYEIFPDLLKDVNN